MRIAVNIAMVVLTLASSTQHVPAQTPACNASSGSTLLPLLELYTSEGCDSCPPADRWLRATFPSRGEARAGAAVLAFHVDYWDGLGWPDRFAAHSFTERQQALVRASGGRTAYTPQVFVQGRDRGLWREPALMTTVNGLAREPARARLQVGSRIDGGAAIIGVDARLQDARSADAQVRIALTEDDLASSVTAGENAGVRLVHGHVVRALIDGPAFDASGRASGEVRIPLPRERGRDATIVAFVEHRGTHDILQSLAVPLCGA